ncbi:Flp pilus assembly protein TadG [Mycoplana sp. BE70]|uniref:TadE/TadG family type IV pilus assembly protein n=1 Tax=Mycoplana sp. BE70 TaxID=2817775 RepID=UPI002855F018|nr:pilus assembly protein [Mycoplana sp. BE70]MDR6755297.1 Flp pilus assembly protein TadG [Mycoplana sp. BE70]
MLTIGKRTSRKSGSFRRVLGDRRGATALEFAILAPIFLGVVFAIIETCVAYVAEQVLLNANDAMARRIRMGEITFNTGRPTDKTKEQFRALFCDELVVLLSCTPEEAMIASRLHVDVRSVTSFNEPTTIPSSLPNNFTPGGKSSINIVRSYYTWPVIVDYLRLVTFHRPEAQRSSINQQLLVATAVFRNEDYK